MNMTVVVARLFGTFWLTFAGCVGAVLAADVSSLGIGFLGVSQQPGFDVREQVGLSFASHILGR